MCRYLKCFEKVTEKRCLSWKNKTRKEGEKRKIVITFTKAEVASVAAESVKKKTSLSKN